MSRLHYLVCHDSRKFVAIGQGWETLRLWTGDPGAMKALHRFLCEHAGQPIIYLTDDEVQHFDVKGFGVDTDEQYTEIE